MFALRRAARAVPELAQRGFAAGPAGAVNGVPEEIYERKARLSLSSAFRTFNAHATFRCSSSRPRAPRRSRAKR
jgi:hypothetical protein